MTSGMKREYYPVIDVCKFIFAIMIVLMHADLLDQNINVAYRLQITVFALIVPYFFVSSGFFIGSKNGNDFNKNLNNIIKSGKRYIRLYLIFGGWYFFINLLKTAILDHDLIHSILPSLHKLLVETPGGGIWFVYTLIWCVGILFFCYKTHNPDKSILISAIFCFFLFLFGAFLFAKPFNDSFIRKAYDKVLLSEHNVLFYGIYFFVGYLVGLKCFVKNEIKLLRLLMGMIVVTYIIYGLFFYDWNNVLTSVFFSLFKLVATLSIFVLALHFKSKTPQTNFIRKMSTVIYFTHWNIIYVEILLKNLVSINQQILAFICAIASVCFSFVLIKSFHGEIYKKLFG